MPSIAEGLAIAERACIDVAIVAEAIAIGQAASPQVLRNANRMIANDHEQNVVFTLVLRLKDVDYALKLAGRLRIPTPLWSAGSEPTPAPVRSRGIRASMKARS